MSQAVELRTAQMRCDTPDCGYAVDVNVRDVRKYVGAQCPRCSAVMVTEETARSVEASLAMIDAVNALIGPVEDSGARGRLSTRFDTAGAIAEATFKKLGADTA